jgi:HD-GYP domain-containing protein (c-di-GMP phosphodiesterase class II)
MRECRKSDSWFSLPRVIGKPPGRAGRLEQGQGKATVMPLVKPSDWGAFTDLSEDSVTQLTLLTNTAMAFQNAKSDRHALWSLLLQTVQETLASERCAILSWPDVSRSVFRRLTREGLSLEPFGYCPKVLEDVKASRKPLVTVSLEKDFDYLISLMCLPLGDLGFLYADRRITWGAFREPELTLFTLLANIFCSASEEATLLEQLESELTSTRLTLDESLIRLTAAIDWRNDGSGHIRRVSEYCTHLAKWNGCADEYAEQLRLAVRMHDIGHLGIPDRLLLKPGLFNKDEWREMRRHTTMGGHVLANSQLPLCQLAHRIALTHHERFDGTGYPNGLRGEDIPLEGRITAVCDAFDAMTSPRVYRDARTPIQAFDIIEAELGKQFDPELGQLFLDNRERVMAIREHMLLPISE